jgi:hypothetical protein
MKEKATHSYIEDLKSLVLIFNSTLLQVGLPNMQMQTLRDRTSLSRVSSQIYSSSQRAAAIPSIRSHLLHRTTQTIGHSILSNLRQSQQQAIPTAQILRKFSIRFLEQLKKTIRE